LAKLRAKIRLLPQEVRDELLNELGDWPDKEELDLSAEESQVMETIFELIELSVDLAISMHEAGIPLDTTPVQC
jgi:hypothetical protein